MGCLYRLAVAAAALGSMTFAPVGARLGHATQSAALKWVFALFLPVVGALIAVGG